MMNADWTAIPPGIILLTAAGLLALLPKMRWLILAAPAAALVMLHTITPGAQLQLPFLEVPLYILAPSPMGLVFAKVFAIAALLGGLYAWRQAATLELVAALGYAGSALTVVLAGDLLSLFIFWELMAIFSSLIIFTPATAASHKAGMRYLLMHLASGVLLMAGIIGHWQATGSLGLQALTTFSISHLLMLGGVLINAGAYPLSCWAADAYPHASASGTVFLSAYTTKTSVFALIMLFPGWKVLIWVGAAMTIYGGLYAWLENGSRRLLIYSLVGQVGFMVAMVGIGSPLALSAAAAHAFAHILYKALLLMSAGSVLGATGTDEMHKLGGLARQLPVAATAALVGGLAICGFPFTCGYISKGLLSSAALKSHSYGYWYVLMAASAATVLYVGLKYPWLVFWRRSQQTETITSDQAIPRSQQLSMLLLSGLCVVYGLFPQLLYQQLPVEVASHAYSLGHVLHKLQLLFAAALVFVLLRSYIPCRPGVTLDIDWLYRKGGLYLWRQLTTTFDRWRRDAFLRLKDAHGFFFTTLFKHHGPRGVLARTWPTGSMALWVALLLTGFLFLYNLKGEKLLQLLWG